MQTKPDAVACSPSRSADKLVGPLDVAAAADGFDEASLEAAESRHLRRANRRPIDIALRGVRRGVIGERLRLQDVVAHRCVRQGQTRRPQARERQRQWRRLPRPGAHAAPRNRRTWAVAR